MSTEYILINYTMLLVALNYNSLTHLEYNCYRKIDYY